VMKFSTFADFFSFREQKTKKQGGVENHKKMRNHRKKSAQTRGSSCRFYFPLSFFCLREARNQKTKATHQKNTAMSRNQKHTKAKRNEDKRKR
jgi:hypothetical protein